VREDHKESLNSSRFIAGWLWAKSKACVVPLTEAWAVSSDHGTNRRRVIMKRSSKRQARRWVIQELTRCLEQRSEPLPPIKSASD
jgi:hypothetical protein